MNKLNPAAIGHLNDQKTGSLIVIYFLIFNSISQSFDLMIKNKLNHLKVSNVTVGLVNIILDSFDEILETVDQLDHPSMTNHNHNSQMIQFRQV